jgi:hypothetical protein
LAPARTTPIFRSVKLSAALYACRTFICAFLGTSVPSVGIPGDTDTAKFQIFELARPVSRESNFNADVTCVVRELVAVVELGPHPIVVERNWWDVCREL